jgi:hypothetical protein
MDAAHVRFAHVNTTGWDAFLAIAEGVNLGAIHLLAKVGVSFLERRL